MNKLNEWNDRYQTTTSWPLPCRVLSDYTYLLPSQGLALDLACGLGANAVLLAQQGLETHAWDYAEVALERLDRYAQSQQLSIKTEVRDVILSPPSPATFDVIVVCHFLERHLAPILISALKPKGLLFYQTFTQTHVDNFGPKNPNFRLSNNELLNLFAQLQLVIYVELGIIGQMTQGLRNEALLIGQKVG